MKTCDKGKLDVILGPMFSGKSSELIRKIQRFKFAGYKCLVICFNHDNRYGSDSIVTRDGDRLPAVLVTHLDQIQNLIQYYSVIGIDDGHFFADLIDFACKVADSGKRVIVAGLDASYERVGFAKMLGLIPIAESVTKLTAICMSCSAEASFTKLITSSDHATDYKYMAVCQGCYEMPEVKISSPFKLIGHSTSLLGSRISALSL